MIYARNYGEPPTIGIPDDRKNDILAIMRSYNEPDGIAEGRFVDFKTERPVKIDCSFIAGNLFWRDEDLYNFEENDLKLNDDFVQALLELGPAR